MRHGPSARCRARRSTLVIHAVFAVLVAVTATAVGPLRATPARAADGPSASTDVTTGATVSGVPAASTTAVPTSGAPGATTPATTAPGATTTIVANRSDDGTTGDGSAWAEVRADTPASGGAVAVEGGVFAAASTVEIWFPATDRRLATTTADLDGEIAVTVALPSVNPGTYEIELVGTTGGGELLTVTTEVDVAEASVVREPVTGDEALGDSIPFALVFLVLGGLFLARWTSSRARREAGRR
ncbi:MAG: hypothetical protein S0880_22740 [Actinomycetota bacterium]|nr:hypothetical protein [Actinomycetota bacterium]